MKRVIIIAIFFILHSLYAMASGNSQLFIIKKATPNEVIKELSQELNSSSVVDNDNNIIYSITDKYYIRSYFTDNRTELFLYSSANKIDQMAAVVKGLKYKTFVFSDTASQKRYNNDFKVYCLNNKLSFEKVKKDTNKLGYKNYNPYSKKIRNKIIEKLEITNNDIIIERIQYAPKYKVSKKANEYEYIITNNTNNDIVINKIASRDFIGLTQIAAYCVIPQWKDFIPLYGFVYGIQTDIEKNKFTRPHPVDEVIKKGESMRILALSKTESDPVADFYFVIGNNKITITFDPIKGVKI